MCSQGGASSENTVNAVPGPNSTLIWVLEHECGTGKAHVGLDRRCGAQRGLLDGEGGSAATELAGARCLGT